MTLTGQLVRLRPMRVEDAEDCLRWLRDPEVSPEPSRWELTLESQREWIENRLDSPDGYFEMETLDGRHIGNAALSGVSSKDHHAELSIHIGEKDAWGRGYGTDAMRLLLRYGFETRGLHRIQLGVHSFNERAIALYTELGFTLEGTRREAFFFQDRYWDEHVMGMLADEWRAAQGTA